MKPHDPAIWDSIADKYDNLRPDQGLTDPAVRAAWADLLIQHLPAAPARILDVGCGTGSLSLLLAEMGHKVAGIDFAPEMIAVAKAKAEQAGTHISFDVQDATAPHFAVQSFDAIICRQTLWALPDRKLALTNWANLLTDKGCLILIEGRFASGNGMSQGELLAALPATLTPPQIDDLSTNHALWGGPINDERILFVTARSPA